MDQQTLLVIMTVFVVIAGIALVMQMVWIFGIYKAARGVEETIKRLMPKVESLIPKVENLVPKVEALVESSNVAIEVSKRQILDITSRTSEILEITHRQLARIDVVMEDATARARVQLDRAEMVLDDTLARAHQTVATVHGGIMKPLREIQGVAAGLRTALNHLVRGGRPNPDQATADEEMFI